MRKKGLKFLQKFHGFLFYFVLLKELYINLKMNHTYIKLTNYF